MPNTLIREGYLDSDRVSALSDLEDRVFFRILLAADDAGRTDGRADKLRSSLFPTRDSVRSTTVRDVVARLIAAGLLREWQWDGKPVLQVLRWQRRSGAQYSRFPDWDGQFRIAWMEVETRDGKQSFCSTSLPNPSATHRQPIANSFEGVFEKSPYTETETETDTKSETETDGGGSGSPPIAPPTPGRNTTRIPPSREDLNAYAAEIGLPSSEVDTFVDHFASNGWKVGGKSPMKDWAAALRNWKRGWQARTPGFAVRGPEKNGAKSGAANPVAERIGREQRLKELDRRIEQHPAQRDRLVYETNAAKAAELRQLLRDREQLAAELE